MSINHFLKSLLAITIFSQVCFVEASTLYGISYNNITFKNGNSLNGEVQIEGYPNSDFTSSGGGFVHSSSLTLMTASTTYTNLFAPHEFVSYSVTGLPYIHIPYPIPHYLFLINLISTSWILAPFNTAPQLGFPDPLINDPADYPANNFIIDVCSPLSCTDAGGAVTGGSVTESVIGQIPEPTTNALLVSGLIGFGVSRKKGLCCVNF